MSHGSGLYITPHVAQAALNGWVFNTRSAIGSRPQNINFSAITTILKLVVGAVMTAKFEDVKLELLVLGLAIYAVVPLGMAIAILRRRELVTVTEA